MKTIITLIIGGLIGIGCSYWWFSGHPFSNQPSPRRSAIFPHPQELSQSGSRRDGGTKTFVDGKSGLLLVQAALREKDFSSKVKLITQALSRTDPKDIQDLLDRASSMGLSPQDRRILEAAMKKTAQQWAAQDPKGVLSWFAADSQPGSSLAQTFLLDVVSSVASADGRATIDAIIGNQSIGPGSSALEVAAISVWMAQDTASAQAWLAGQAVDLRTQIVLNSASGELHNPQAWLSLLADLPPSDTRTAVYGNVIQQMAASDPAATMDYLKTMPDQSLIEAVLPKALIGIGESDPQEALSVGLTFPSTQANQAALAAVVANWTRDTPVPAAAAVTAMQDSGQRDMLVSVVAGIWASGNPQAALSWAGSIPDTATQDEALSAIAFKLQDSSPAVAATAAGKITNSSMQQSVTGRISHAGH